MTIRGIKSYRSAPQITEQTKNRVVNGDGEKASARATGQDTVEISHDGMERYKESLVKSATNELNHNDDGAGVIMADFHTLIGSRMPSIYGEKNGNGEYVPRYFSAEETAENMKKVYAELYDEIVQGHKAGTRKTYVEDSAAEGGYRKLTMDEELAELDKAYQALSIRHTANNFKSSSDALSELKQAGTDYLKGLQEKDNADDEDAEDESTKSGGMVGINAQKLARMLAAAKTRAQVQAVMAQIRSDLQECDSGAAQGMDVDESSYAAAQQLLQQAQQQLGQAENREATPEEEMASALASLM